MLVVFGDVGLAWDRRVFKTGRQDFLIAYMQLCMNKWKRTERRETLRSDDGDNFARALRFSVHCYAVPTQLHFKMRDFTLYGGRKQAMTKFSWNWTPEEFAYLWQSKWIVININAMKIERTWINSLCNQIFSRSRRPPISRSLKKERIKNLSVTKSFIDRD